MKNSIIIILTFMALALFAACRPCECLNDIYDDSIPFQFDTTQYSFAEIGTPLVVKYNRNDTIPLDTIITVPAANRGYFYIGETNTDFENFDYIIQPSDTLAYDYLYRVSEIKIEGNNEDGKCKCYQNTLKTFKINGVAVNKTNSDTPYLLKK